MPIIFLGFQDFCKGFLGKVDVAESLGGESRISFGKTQQVINYRR